MALIIILSISCRVKYSDLVYGNPAVSGYDTVAYFTLGQPVKGSFLYTYEYQDAEWRFSSQANRDLFIANPEQYAPQYGGYCSWAVGHGYTAPGSPTDWHIYNNKLYLNVNASVHQSWLQDKEALIISGDRNWPGVLD